MWVSFTLSVTNLKGTTTIINLVDIFVLNFTSFLGRDAADDNEEDRKFVSSGEKGKQGEIITSEVRKEILSLKYE